MPNHVRTDLHTHTHRRSGGVEVGRLNGTGR